MPKTRPQEAPVDGSALPPGTLLGRYVIERMIGAGGMGIVYAAYDRTLQRRVALKLLRPSVRLDAAHERLLREAQSMARLNHRNVIAVHDVGTVAQGVFVAMELCEGHNLREWLRERKRTWREVTEVLVQAGRGLLAAHRAGLVHRDFKPDNVLLDGSGRVCVTDFGLARSFGEQVVLEGPAASEKLCVTTQTGHLAGSPAYMAPEQYRGEPASASTDQFSFAVALYESVYGVRPFEGENLHVLQQAIASGQRSPLPGHAKVPAALRRVILRGLAADPAARYPGMQEILQALEQILRRRTTRWLVLGGAVLAAGGLAIALAGADPVCRSPGRRWRGIWDEDRREILHRAFSQSGRGYATSAWQSLHAALGHYADEWTAEQRAVCEARTERRTDPLVALRQLCLDDARQEVKALTDHLATGDASMLEHAVESAESLPAPSACRARSGGRAAAAPPQKDEAAVRAAQDNLADIRALERLGKYPEARERAAALAKEARTLGYRPLLAEALLTLGRLDDKVGDPSAAEKTLLDAAAAAESVGDAVVGEESLATLISVSGELNHDKQAQAWSQLAEAQLERLPGDEDARVQFLIRRGGLRDVIGQHDEAVADLEKALALLRRTQKPPQLQVAEVLSNLADLRFNRNEYERAKSLAEEALRLREEVLGGEHPDVASSLQGIGDMELKLDRTEAALAAFRRALDIQEKSLPPDHPDLALSLDRVGMMLCELGRCGEASPFVERALRIAETKLGPENTHTAEYIGHLALLKERAGLLEEALVYAERSLALRRKARGDGLDTSVVLSNLGVLLFRMRRFTEAELRFREALAIERQAYGPDNSGSAFTLAGLGACLLARGRPAEAVPLLERALALAPKTSPRVSTVRFFLARALWESGQDKDRAGLLAREAARNAGPHGLVPRTEMVAWLAKHSQRSASAAP